MLKSAWIEKDQIDNFLKERRLMRSLERFVGGRRKVSLMLEILSRRFFLKLNLSDHRSILTDLQRTLKGKWRYMILSKPPIHNHIRGNDHLAMSKLIASLTKGNVHSPLAQRLLTRYTSQVSQDMKVELMRNKWRFTNSFTCVDLISNGDFVGIMSSDGRNV
nr:coatomer subunit gamma [Tanacetum cinerariifolium]